SPCVVETPDDLIAIDAEGERPACGGRMIQGLKGASVVQEAVVPARVVKNTRDVSAADAAQLRFCAGRMIQCLVRSAVVDVTVQTSGVEERPHYPAATDAIGKRSAHGRGVLQLFEGTPVVQEPEGGVQISTVADNAAALDVPRKSPTQLV